MAKTKNIKVAYSNRYGNRSCTTYPKIQMEGKWLEELGFTIGTRLMVEYEEGSIRIRPFTAEENAYEDERLLLAEMERNHREQEKLLRALNSQMEELPRVAEPETSYGTPSKSHSSCHR